MVKPVQLPCVAALLPELREHIGAAATVNWVEVTGSTNADVLMLLREEMESQAWDTRTSRPIILGSHTQTAGRGQRGRRWEAATGQAILMSIGWHCRIPFPGLGLAALSLGHAALDAIATDLSSKNQSRLRLKWPNDLQIEDRKLGGILVETVTRGQDLMVVAGLGVNLEAPQQLSDSLQRPIASWAELEASIRPATLICRLVQHWLSAFDSLRCLKEGFDPSLPSRHAPRDSLKDRCIEVLDRPGDCTFTAKGIDGYGHLLLQNRDKKLEPLAHGSVRLVQESTQC